MEINELDEKKRSVLKAEKPLYEMDQMKLEKRKDLLWDLIRAKFANGDPWAVAEICEIQYTLTRREVELEQGRMESKQSIDEMPNSEWAPLKRKQSKP